MSCFVRCCSRALKAAPGLAVVGALALAGPAAAAGSATLTSRGDQAGTVARPLTFVSASPAGNVVSVSNPGSQTTTTVGAPIGGVQIQATDSAAAQTLTYSATGLPAGLSITPTTGSIAGTPTTKGVYNVTVTATDTTGASGSTTFTWTVGQPQASTSITNSVAPNPALETQPVTLTATVTPVPDGGTVAFDDGDGTLPGCDAQPINSSGVATCQTSSLPVGSDQLTATYSGDPSYQGSTSASVAETILPDTPQNLAKLTLQYVDSSAKFQALGQFAQALINVLANQAIAALGSINPQITPAQLASLAEAYKQGVAVLNAQGWLTAGQANTLNGLANNLNI